MAKMNILKLIRDSGKGLPSTIFDRSKNSAGFTLIELMVVISVIAILLGFGAVSFTNAQRKARNATRRSDIRSVQNAFEQYFAVNGSYGAAANCSTMDTADYFPGGFPTDPKPNWPVTPSPAGGWVGGYRFDCDTVNTTYCSCSRLEVETGNSDDGDCAFDSSGDEEYFCVVNQQ